MERQNEIEDLEQIKKNWADMNRRLERLEKSIIEEGRRVSRENVRTARENLARRYRKFVIIELVMFVVLPVQYVAMGHRGFGDMSWLNLCAVLLGVFFLVAAVMDSYLYRGVRSIDPGTMSLSEVFEKARRLKRNHHIFMLILFLFAIVVVGAIGMSFIDDNSVLLSMGIGGIVGASIGLYQYLQMMADYRAMMKDYKDE